MSAVPRVGGRVLLVDPAERVLLIHERLEDGSTHWLTPGGGVEGDEQPWQAAQREAAEEAGLDLDLDPGAEPVLVTRREWSWAGVVYDQVDSFYLVRVPDGLAVQPRKLTSVEEETWLGLRWWTVEELLEADAVIVPPQLGEVLTGVLRKGSRAG
jgi:8-oxo-dGTP pyrophosphatase MutT (NUDIX family)